MTYCEVRAEKEGTVADLRTQSRYFSINVWRKLILPCTNFSTLNYMEQDIRRVKSI